MPGWHKALVTITLLAFALGHSPTVIARSLSDILSDQERTKAELSGVGQAETSVLQELFRMGQDLQALRSEIGVLAAQHRQVEAELDGLRAEQTQLRTEHDRRRRLFGQRVRFYYMEGAAGLMELVLDANDFGDFLDRVYLIDLIVKADASVLAALRRLRVELDQQEAKLQKKGAALRAVATELELRQTNLAAAIQEREERLAALRDRRSDVETALAELDRVWMDDVQPVLAEFGRAIHTLTLAGAELEPDAVQLQLVPPRLRIVVSSATLDRFLGASGMFAGFKTILRPDQVALTGIFAGVPLELAGKLTVHEGVVLRFQPDYVRFFGVSVPLALTRELLGSGALDLNVADALRGGRLQEITVEEGRVIAVASLR